MKRLFNSTYLQVRWEPRWPAMAIGFYNGRPRRTFLVLVSPIVIEIGRRS